MLLNRYCLKYLFTGSYVTYTVLFFCNIKIYLCNINCVTRQKVVLQVRHFAQKKIYNIGQYIYLIYLWF